MEIMSQAECQRILERAKKEVKGKEAVRVFQRIYGVLVISHVNNYKEIEEESKRVLISVYKERRGRDLFISGEFLEVLRGEIKDILLDTNKKCLQEILGAKIEGKAVEEVEAKEFKELNPALSMDSGREKTRTGRGRAKKQIRGAREKARAEAQEYVRKKREEDREYAEKLRRMEESVRKP